MFLADRQRVNEETVSLSLSLSISDSLYTSLAPQSPPPLGARDEWLTEEWRKYPAARFLSSCNAIHAVCVSVSLWRVCVFDCVHAHGMRVCLCVRLRNVGSFIIIINICVFISDNLCFTAVCFFRSRALPNGRHTNAHAHTHTSKNIYLHLQTVKYVVIYSHTTIETANSYITH